MQKVRCTGLLELILKKDTVQEESPGEDGWMDDGKRGGEGRGCLWKEEEGQTLWNY